MLHLPRIMFAAPSSGSGKTMITCGILEALSLRGLNPASFKCGPDYIDPMFHTRVIGTPSRNLDTFFTDIPTTRYLFAKNAQNAGISVLEGVMGIYDGLGGISPKASSYDLAVATNTPVILIVNARGMSLSVIPMIQGYLNYEKVLSADEETWNEEQTPMLQREREKLCIRNEQRRGHQIRGVILNQTTKSTYLLLKNEIERQTGVRVYGYVPRLDDAAVESRHLGLVTPDEITDLKTRLVRLAAELEQCLDLDGILALAEEAEDYENNVLELPQSVRKWLPGCCDNPIKRKFDIEDTISAKSGESGQAERFGCGKLPRIAVAKDEAFCFYYQDNLELLELLGAQIVPFSPLHDNNLPEGISGLIIGGGYPELYAKQLSENEEMKTAIREVISTGIPYLAECGGFMYLHETMEDMEGKAWPMCGCISGKSYRTTKLGRFGYITLRVRSDATAEGEKTADNRTTTEWTEKANDQVAMESEKTANDQAAAESLEAVKNQEMCRNGFLRPGESIRAHEFHYFDSTDPGDAYTAKKPTGKRTWNCIHTTDHSAAGYPHLYYWSDPGFASRFLASARAWTQTQEEYLF
ncbi:MAG: cobyrinic acid a,c-diamide synthase [Clostridiales bacterium]|nr:cobyrinic acid a,c-diamide synthase [Clostridiales bacterium]